MDAFRLLGRVRNVAALSGHDQRLALSAFVYLIVIDVALRLFGFRRTVQWTEPSTVSVDRAVTELDLRRVYQYAHWLQVASRHHFVRARCLHRSLALLCWLRRQRLPGELRIGVRKEGILLEAHAWVLVGGEVVNDQPAAVSGFVPLANVERLLGSSRHCPGALDHGGTALVGTRGVKWW